MKTVYVGLSGGVDSSVAAAVLQRQGYHVVGAHIINWVRDVGGVECPWWQDLADARAVAARLDIPFKVFDFRREYKQLVVDAMVAEYQAGRTPNPDVLCNQEIKFKLFMQAALADGADLIATGHYARIVPTVEGGELNVKDQISDSTFHIPHSTFELHRGLDPAKDQSYFLYRVDPAALSVTRFPLGELTKPEVRRLAAEFGLPTATKPDSQGICFVGPVGLKPFLSQFIPSQPGDVVDQAGRVLGRHDGAVYYTIGQRQGLGIGGGRPFYVLAKDMATNRVIVTADPADLELQTDEFILEQPHWLGEVPAAGRKYQVQVRYRGAAIAAQLQATSDERRVGQDSQLATCNSQHAWAVKLTRPERAVAAGQSAVVYDGDRVVGGGIIAAVVSQTHSKLAQLPAKN